MLLDKIFCTLGGAHTLTLEIISIMVFFLVISLGYTKVNEGGNFTLLVIITSILFRCTPVQNMYKSAA